MLRLAMIVIYGLVALTLAVIIAPIVIVELFLVVFRKVELIVLYRGDEQERDRAEYKQTF